MPRKLRPNAAIKKVLKIYQQNFMKNQFTTPQNDALHLIFNLGYTVSPDVNESSYGYVKVVNMDTGKSLVLTNLSGNKALLDGGTTVISEPDLDLNTFDYVDYLNSKGDNPDYLAPSVANLTMLRNRLNQLNADFDRLKKLRNDYQEHLASIDSEYNKKVSSFITIVNQVERMSNKITEDNDDTKSSK
ncbi:hypothetical protein [Lentilactobacillus sunkii]|uniref:Uncharacterized protein n=1 Tax=Lentilactobacillus sunkii DSM 19904 TaxID=1423808 RepID=A0A0R1L0X1_9LACO|nr:hypothetical protein [Lentilactobacillus sunkii]KRK89494.1 hypothetical protein FD17_GL001079 [Lentilactobacillus sunkii DSM 19904]